MPTRPIVEFDRLMRPRSVAIVGASAEPDSIGGAVLANLDRCGYRGDIHLVSRRVTEINGRRCVGAIDELPEHIDAAVLVVPQRMGCNHHAANRAGNTGRRDRDPIKASQAQDQRKE
jgi:acyl-CoA synthetase (NDP forming)